MRLDAIAAPLTLLAVALPFLFSYSHPPSSNFWPLVAAWACGAVLALSEKNALAYLNARASGPVSALPWLDRKLMRLIYTRKYSKRK